MTLPTPISEVDFEGNPTATYHDTLFYDDTVQSYWRCDSAAAFTDEKGLNSGTFGGAPSLVASLLPLDANQALSFDGVDDYAIVPSSASLLQAGSWALEGLLRFPGALPAATKTLATKGSFRVDIRSDGKLQFTVKNEVGGVMTSTTVVGNTVLVSGTAYHVRCVHDATLDLLLLYVNGRLEASATHTAGTELWGLPLLFAARHGGTLPAFGTVATSTHAASTSWVVTAPASIAVGDLLVAHLNGVGVGNTVTAPAGWTQWASNDAGTARTYVFWKIAAAGDVGAANYTFTISTTRTGQSAMTRFTGVDASQPFANPPYVRTPVNFGTFASAGPHLALSDDVLLVWLVSDQLNSTWTFNVGTERYDTDGAGGQGANGIAMATLGQNVAATQDVGLTPSLSHGVNQGAIIYTMILKGPDAQDFVNVELDEWTFASSAGGDDVALDHSEARLSGVGTYTDITVDSRSLHTKRGRQYELDKIEAGEASEVLADPNRDYDPSNTGSPHYPNVIPKRRTRKRAQVGANVYPLFQGFVERWPVEWLAPAYQEVKITVSDGFAPLALAPVAGTLASDLSGAQIHRLLDMAKWPRADRAIDDGLFVMGEWALSAGQKALPAIQEIADSELGLFFINAAGVATFHDYAHRWSAARSLTSQVTFADDGTGIPYRWGGLKPSFDDDNTINQWEVSTSTGQVATATDVVGGRRSFPLAQTRSTRLASIGDARTQALALLQETARPGQRFDSLTVEPEDDATWDQILPLEISDRVTVVRAGFTQECFVEGIELDMAPDNWTVVFMLSPVNPATYEEMIVRDGPVSYYPLDEAV